MDWRSIVYWVLMIISLLFMFYLYSGAAKPQSNSNTVRAIAEDGVLVAIIVAMGFIPNFGYIQVAPGISLTLIHIPVLIGAYLFGTKRALIYGLAFGLTSWIQANLNPTGFNFFFIVPWVSVLPRVIFAFVSGLIFTIVKKNHKIYKSSLILGLTAMGLTLLHTLLVFACLYAFYFQDIHAMMSSQVSGMVVGTVAGLIMIGAVGESILSAIIVPLIAKATRKLVNRGREQNA